MKIERKFDFFIETKRRYVIRQFSSVKAAVCAECGEPMLSPEQAAAILGVTQRQIFRIIETETAHFDEAESGATTVCLNSLGKIL